MHAVRHMLPEQSIRVTPKPTDRQEVVLGYAGSITAADAFECLIRALDTAGWRIAGRQVVLRLMGARYTFEPRGPQRIEYYGWQPVEQAVALLSTADLLYLPQPFTAQLRELAELSFPTKLSTYLAAGRPVVLHAPAHASVVPFFRRFPFGAWCDSLQGADLLGCFQRLLTDEAAQLAAVGQSHAAVAEELNQRVFFQRFREFLGLPQPLGERAAA